MRSTASPPPPAALTPRDLADLIDISAVQAGTTEAEVRELARIAVVEGFAAAHVLPNFVPLLRSLVPPGCGTRVGGPVGFPSGGHTTRIKVAEAVALAADGAEELDMMINVGRLKSGDRGYVAADVRAVVEAIAPLPLKVILEVALLTDDEIREGSAIIADSGAAFVKTGSGWTPGATTVTNLGIVIATVAGRAAVKASGGIRDLATIAAMRRLGVSRFGINARVAVDLLRQCAMLRDGRLVIDASAA